MKEMFEEKLKIHRAMMKTSPFVLTSVAIKIIGQKQNF
jgi:hypothetical protein